MQPTLDFTLTLSATQADTLEDALLTFQPHTGLVIHPTMPQGERGRYEAHLPNAARCQTIEALTQYREHIEPQSQAVASLLRLLQGGSPT
ncbi:hypothetical protein [Armatimonas sp.]|uniref:hypothetical protein n=1 Tax=Armatimonas sp. TaxID=1872638 RepID=UPI00374D1E94